jgi:ankyrin repeat protein
MLLGHTWPTPLHISAKHCHFEATEILLREFQNGISSPAWLDVKATDVDKETAAHLAAAHGSIGSPRSLLAVDKDLANMEDQAGQTPLHKKVVPADYSFASPTPLPSPRPN